MPGIHDTAYPRLKSTLTAKELCDVYTPTADEIALAKRIAKGTGAKIYFLVLLKTFQRLGYFTMLNKVPQQIAEHIALLFGVHYGAVEWQAYNESGTRRRHVAVIREHLNVRAFDETARRLLAETVRRAAHIKEDTADIINIAIEELVRHRYELPGFTTLLEDAQHGKAEVNRCFYASVCNALGTERCGHIDELLDADQPNKRSLWQIVKVETGGPTLLQFRYLLGRLKWLTSLGLAHSDFFASVPASKVEHFALEAKSLDAARMSETEPRKRYTLAAALVRQQIARCLDDLGEMFVKRMRKAHRVAQNALAEYLLRRQPQTDRMIATLHHVLVAYGTEGSDGDRLAAIGQIIGDQAETLIENCEAHAVYAENNYLPFLWKFCAKHRQLLFAILDQVQIISTSQDASLEQALAFIRQNRFSRKEWLQLPSVNDVTEGEVSSEESRVAINLSWVPDKWWEPVTGRKQHSNNITYINRRYFEMCVFTELAHELKSGDMVIAGSGKFSDYRQQFVSVAEYQATVKEYCEQVGLPVEKKTLIEELRRKLEDTAATADASFPENECLKIEKGEPVLSRLERRPEPQELKLIEQLLAERLKPISILDAVADTEKWLNWTRHFGPLSGHDAKPDDPPSRYVATAFCYGSNLGPAQTARSLKAIDRRHLSWINQRHITEEKLDAAITDLINAFNCFLLPKQWGSGGSASADGTKWDMYEQNLLSEYHIRYGGYGGIGYYHVSDTYIALFSHFIPCGVREAVYILDGLLKNKSDIQPDTVHADSQGQSAPVFGLAHLLGIKLMPRIRNWKDLKFYRPRKEASYTHIDKMFSDTIDWGLITERLDDMLRVAVSIKAGSLTSLTILRKLGIYSRKNRLYVAFRELGRAVWTEFLLRYISEVELRHVIQSAINKSEGFNKFAQWVSFGGHGVIAENDRDEQRKLIKYNHLVANCLIFYNVSALTEALYKLTREGIYISDEVLTRLSPYVTEHINRLGDYNLDMSRKPPALNYHLNILPYKLMPPS